MNNGYIPWGLKNSCDVAVYFDYDFCDMNPDLQPVCVLKTGTVPAHSEFSDSNYHIPANVRHYR